MARSRSKPPKPPKPEDQPATPRLRGTAAVTGRQGIINALAGIANAELTPQDITDYGHEMAAVGNDRAVAILLAVSLEQALEFALESRLHIPRARWRELFGINAPLGTFDYKIRMAWGIGMLTDATRSNFDLVRRIRNAFAHTIRPISFDTPEIADACLLLTVPQPFPPLAWPTPAPLPHQSVSRQRYQHACQTSAHNLFVIAGVYVSLTQVHAPQSF